MIMNIKSFDSYDIADMAKAFPEYAECTNANENFFYNGKRYAVMVCYGRLKIANHDELEVVTKYEVSFCDDDTQYKWNFTDKNAAIVFIKECYEEEKGCNM